MSTPSTFSNTFALNFANQCNVRKQTCDSSTSTLMTNTVESVHP